MLALVTWLNIVAVPIPEKLIEKAPSIACKMESHYVGAILDFKIALEIKDKGYAWTYTHLDQQLGLKNLSTMTGTYEIEGDLALFTIEKGGEGKFGVNFIRVKDNVFFNRFVPTKDGRLSLTRQWFAKRDGKWQPLELRRISFVTPNLDALGDRLEVHFQGERVTWNEAGKMEPSPLEAKALFKQQAKFYYALENPGAPAFVPRELSFRRLEGQTLAAGDADHISTLNGFYPALAQQLP